MLELRVQCLRKGTGPLPIRLLRRAPFLLFNNCKYNWVRPLPQFKLVDASNHRSEHSYQPSGGGICKRKFNDKKKKKKKKKSASVRISHAWL
ncbi:hypothetical protein POVWA1_039250 [Plasmodium ovale wallikeri]|uniref:Uncharacterized protein n=1 Tax=Plasmodium ovale wallikeri TaxID=864142 RepID=A0A1A8Z559_PLAOA|nr:hypothetical protein POVWA1_039250 [Plasmodium ovale wallikeri]